jgi:4-diphosphocytidyl-2-C-methyl-D-erythritol kinase
VTRVLAPAKLTLSLAVTGIRPDGYHELRAEMVALSLADELTVTEGGRGLSVSAGPGVRADAWGNEQDNLITRALAAVGRRAAVHVVKRIPPGGGLGGGSSDAAAILRWAGCTDVGTARSLGSDVPFSLVGGRAVVEGTGEVVTPLAFVPRGFLLLIPPFGVDTRRVYGAWDDGCRPGSPARGANALREAAQMVEPRLGPWRDALGELTGEEPELAGSGSTWFVEGGPTEAGTAELPWLQLGAARARLVRAHTVPVGWDGS